MFQIVNFNICIEKTRAELSVEPRTEQQQIESDIELSVETKADTEIGKLSVEISTESRVETRTEPSV